MNAPKVLDEKIIINSLDSIQSSHNPIYIINIPSEDSIFHRELRINYTFFHSDYGFFFLSIALIVGGRYSYVKIKNR